MEMTRRKLLKTSHRKCRFWFEYVKHPTKQAWGGGHWQLFKAPGEQIPISVRLHPLHPLNYLSFHARKPMPEEIAAYVARHVTLEMPLGDQRELAQLLEQSFGYQIRSELVPGVRLEIYDGTFLCAKMESILGRTRILA